MVRWREMRLYSDVKLCSERSDSAS